MSLGDAYINIHADTTPFRRELETQVGAAVAAVEAQQAAVAARPANRRSTTDADAQALKALTERNKLLYKEDQASKVQAAKDADAEIARLNRDTTIQIENDLRRQTEAQRAATDARAAIRAKDKADNDQVVKAYVEGQKAIQTAERAAYVEEGLRARARAAALKAADDQNRSFGERIVALSSTLSRIGFTGQTRLITLGLSFGAPIALLGAFGAAAAAATAAVTVFGIKSADSARSATLQFQSLGLSADQAKAQFKALQDLSKSGLQIANLDADAGRLLQLGITAEDTTKILKTLADVFAKNGDVGAVLQKDIDDTSKKLQTLANTAKVTPRTFQAAVASLGIGVTAQQAFDQVKKNLDVTEKQLDSIIKKGQLSGAALAQAALQVAAANSAGALANAVNNSPTQALEALKSSAQATLANAFQNQGTTIAGFINQVSTSINGFLAEFAPKVIAILHDSLPGIIDAIKPFGDALIASLQLVGPTLRAIGPILTNLSGRVSGFFRQLSIQGSETQKFIQGLKDTFKGLGDILSALGPTLSSIGNGLSQIFQVAGALEPVLSAISDAIKAITNIPFVGSLTSFATVVGILSLALGLLIKALNGVASAAVRAATSIGILSAAEGVGAASAKRHAAATAASAAETTALGVAGGVAARGGLAGLGRAALSLGSKAGPLGLLIVTAGTAGFKIGEDLARHAGLGADGVNKQDFSPIRGALYALSREAARTITFLDALGNVHTGSGLDPLHPQASVSLKDAANAAKSGTPLNPTSINQQKFNIPDVPNLDKFGADLAGGGGGGGASAANSKAEAAKARAQAFADALKTIIQSINDFKNNVGTDTAKQVNSTFESIEKSIAAAFKADKKREPSALVKFLEGERKTLVADATEREKLAKAIEAGDAAALAAIQGAQQFASLTNVATTVAQFGKAILDLSRLHIVLPGDTLASGLTTQQQGVINLQTALDKRLAVLQKFQRDVQTLIHSGLRADLVSDIISGGADANGGLAGALAGANPNQIGLLNATQQAIADVTDKIGKNAGDAAASAGQKAGQAVADGILQGLKDKNKELVQAMKDLANALTDELKKTWKIKSPSRVGHEMGHHYGTGIEHGLISTHGALARAAAGMAEAATPNMTRSGIPLPRAGGEGYAAQSVVHHHQHTKEINAPVTIYATAGANEVGDAVGRNIAKFLR